MNTKPWYDSIWLNSFVKAKEYIRINHPQRLEEFCRSFDRLKTRPDFDVCSFQGLFPEETRARLKELVCELKNADLEKHELLRFGRMVVHDHPVLTQLQNSITRRVAEAVGEEVEPMYNFLSLYNNLGVCRVHMDAPSAKWTLDYCIEQSSEWPIHFSQVVPWPEDWEYQGDDWESVIKSDPKNRFTSFTLQEGNAILFGGSSQWHYRDRIQRVTASNFCNLAFFHFIPAGTRNLVSPSKWAAHFGMPELQEVVSRPGELDTSRIA